MKRLMTAGLALMAATSGLGQVVAPVSDAPPKPRAVRLRFRDRSRYTGAMIREATRLRGINPKMFLRKQETIRGWK